MTSAPTQPLPGIQVDRNGGPATILVVDDDPSMRTILSLSLRLYGYATLAAGEGEAALAIAREHPEIRLVILDVVMSGLSGKELAERLKAGLPGASILYCSGHPASALARYEIDVSSDNFIQKPCRPPELQQKIEELLANRKPDRPVRGEST
jgi:two-component system cell cycle sensor histidine kinase/response regulator CckA